MSIVQHTRRKVQPKREPAPTWDDRIELEPELWPDFGGIVDVPVELAPAPIDEEEAYYASINRVGFAGDVGQLEPAVDAAEWLRARGRSHRNRSHEDGDIHDLVADAINDVLAAFLFFKTDSARRLLETAGCSLKGIDLDGLALPDGRESHAAELLDAEAAPYLAMGGILARLVAAAILRRATAVEDTGAQTLREYHAGDAEAALHMALETVADEIPAEYPGAQW